MNCPNCLKNIMLEVWKDCKFIKYYCGECKYEKEI